jgi:hypothetical protein
MIEMMLSKVKSATIRIKIIMMILKLVFLIMKDKVVATTKIIMTEREIKKVETNKIKDSIR